MIIDNYNFITMHKHSNLKIDIKANKRKIFILFKLFPFDFEHFYVKLDDFYQVTKNWDRSKTPKKIKEIEESRKRLMLLILKAFATYSSLL